MKNFAELVNRLGTTTGTLEKLKYLSAYFSVAPDRDKVWVIAIFSGRRPRRIVSGTQMRQWCSQQTGLPEWLFEECYHTVGDLAETIALLLPETNPADRMNENENSLSFHLEKLVSLASSTEEEKKEYILRAWQQLGREELFVFNKLITGGFRIGISQKMMVNALAVAVNLDPAVIAHRISGSWDPGQTSFESLLGESSIRDDDSKPYPFFLAHSLEEEPGSLGEPGEWQAEWKWDGIRGQLIKRSGSLFVWSRGEELMTDKFPELGPLADLLPEGVALDGEIMPWKEGQPLAFSRLQTRIGRKKVTARQLRDTPVSFIAYDLMEYKGKDIRDQVLSDRRVLLENILSAFSHPAIQLSPVLSFRSWKELAGLREKSRNFFAEGCMLKRKKSVYQAGRKRGDWWKWKIDPLLIDCVMIYAQKGHGRRSNLYTDYTFAVRDGDRLVSFAKAYSGLSDAEIREVDAFVKKNSLEKFGPVRTVRPELVFELAFEGISASNRHKSGVALRFPRIRRWRKDKPPEEINTLDDLKEMLTLYGK